MWSGDYEGVKKLKELIEKIEQWGKDRGLDKKATLEGQTIKTAEEIAELIIGISKNNLDVIKDSIGDVYVTLVIGNMVNCKFDMVKVYDLCKHKFDRIPKGHISYDKSKQIRLLADKIEVTLRSGYEREILEGTQYLLLRLVDTYDLDFIDCVESAYEEIKDRKGRVVGGTFVKESDLHD